MNEWIMSFSDRDEEKLSDIYTQGYLRFKEVSENCEWTIEDLDSLDQLCKKILDNYDWDISTTVI